MVVKTNWDTVNCLARDMNTCLGDLRYFRELYEKETMPSNWERFIKEGFRGLMVSLFELSKSYIIHAKKYNKLSGIAFVDILKDCVDSDVLIEDSIIVLETLRVLRNDNSHGYDMPDFDEIFNFYKDYEYVFDDILYRSKALRALESEATTTKLNL